MEDTTEPTQKRKKRNSDKGEEVEGAVPPKVKQEERSDAGKEEVPRRRVEERVPKESKRKTAEAASRQEAVVEKAARPGKATQSIPSDSDGDSYSASRLRYSANRSMRGALGPASVDTELARVLHARTTQSPVTSMVAFSSCDTTLSYTP